MVEISTSILNIESDKAIKTIYNLETSKIDYFHIDVMDGEFVDNNTVDKMLELSGYIKGVTTIPLDVHLMVKNVQQYVDMFLPFEPNIITIHYECFENEQQLLEMIQYIHDNNCKVGVAIKPNTNASELYSIISKINMALIMTVEPGKGGQELLPETIKKIEDVTKYININNLDTLVEADGGINLQNCNRLKESGADILVVGTALLKSDDYEKTVASFKNLEH